MRRTAPSGSWMWRARIDLLRAHGMVQLHPMCGGVSPEFGWSSLRLLVEEAIPAARSLAAHLTTAMSAEKG